MKRFLMLAIPAFALSLCYAWPWYFGDLQSSHQAIYPQIKPFVYRALMPWIAQAVLWVAPVRLDILTLILISLSGVAFILALWYLAESFYSVKEWQVIALFGGYVALFCRYPKIYDLMSAALFTLCLAFMARGMWGAYLLTFALAVVNRETALLLIPVTVAWIWSRE